MARECVAAAKHKCEACGRYLYVGESYVLFWDDNKQLFTLHKRCAKLWKIVWMPIPRLKWERYTHIKWRTRFRGRVYEIYLDKKSGWFGLIKEGDLVFDVTRDLVLAQSRVEKEAAYDDWFGPRRKIT